MNHAPVFTAINENGAINQKLSVNGAPVFIKPIKHLASGQKILFTYTAYDRLDEGNQLLIWTHTSSALTYENISRGYYLMVPREVLLQHHYGHAKAFYAIKDECPALRSMNAHVYVDLRTGKHFI